MYAFIEGEVCEKLNGSLTLLAGGVGYQLFQQHAPGRPLSGRENALLYLSVRPGGRDGALRLCLA